MKTIIYRRVSTDRQITDAQDADLNRWAAAQGDAADIDFLPPDKFTGRSMKRPMWSRVQAAIDAGTISRIVVWRLDRLGRTAAGLTRLFEQIIEKNINLVSLRDGIDLSTPAGRLMANVIASVAQYETEIRAERIKAGIDAKRDPRTGKCTWGGSAGRPLSKKQLAKREKIYLMREGGFTLDDISRVVEMGKTQIVKIIKQYEAQQCDNSPLSST